MKFSITTIFLKVSEHEEEEEDEFKFLEALRDMLAPKKAQSSRFRWGFLVLREISIKFGKLSFSGLNRSNFGIGYFKFDQVQN